jgi:hypothetical protein
MKREADYTIKGFIYQFNLTLLKILESNDDTEITVEGIIEDIDLKDGDQIEAVQCKYHETQETYTLSLFYKPILQMMAHYCKNNNPLIQYTLYAHLPNQKDEVKLTKNDLDTIASTKDLKLGKYVSQIDGSFDANNFLNHFKIEFGESFDELVQSTKNKLSSNNFDPTEIDTLIYPNAINEIANYSIKHDATQRIVTKSGLLKLLKEIRKTAITKWTLSLKDYKKIIDARRKQLKPNLDKNSRLRYFLISDCDIEDFDQSIVTFISDYIDKFHSKPAHIQTPVFALDCDQVKFDEIRLRLFKKGIKFRDGFVTPVVFDENYFYEPPITKIISKNEIQREFSIRLLRYEQPNSILVQKPCDDLFIITSKKYPELYLEDLIIEQMSISKLQELKYIIGVADVYE